MDQTDRAIDLNADLGEGCPWDEPLLARVSSASVSCGAHAGDPATIARTLREAKARGVVVGAHPGYPDREGFGRRERAATAAEVERWVREQVEALMELAEGIDVPVRFVKPHGALYNQAQRQDEIAAGVVAALASFGLPVVGQPGGRVEIQAQRAGLRFVAEGFADRRYQDDGRLVPRGEPGAILDDPTEVEAQALCLVEQGIATLCLHGDNPDSVALADRLHAALQRAGVVVRSFA